MEILLDLNILLSSPIHLFLGIAPPCTPRLDI